METDDAVRKCEPTSATASGRMGARRGGKVYVGTLGLKPGPLSSLEHVWPKYTTLSCIFFFQK